MKLISLFMATAMAMPLTAVAQSDIYLRLTVKEGAKMTFAYSLDGKKFKPCGDEFQMREGKWIGAKFGFCAEEPAQKSPMGFLDIDWIRVTK